ncbi:MAG TPA: hypothetical protein VKA26_05675 [Ignavibacteriaceae bacterium]|nr:hypothetical protein [Ignavibacteriaceae bacterium]
MKKFRLRFDPRKLSALAGRYEFEGDLIAENEIIPRIKKKGYLNKKDFLTFCEWKTPRTKPLCKKNDEVFIKDVTRLSFSTNDEKVKIEILLLLKGVSWPTASVILHYASDFQYPILDYRALWSLGLKKPPVYNFQLWWDYTLFCRSLAQKHKINLRELDKALWQYSVENQ